MINKLLERKRHYYNCINPHGPERLVTRAWGCRDRTHTAGPPETKRRKTQTENGSMYNDINKLLSSEKPPLLLYINPHGPDAL